MLKVKLQNFDKEEFFQSFLVCAGDTKHFQIDILWCSITEQFITLVFVSLKFFCTSTYAVCFVEAHSSVHLLNQVHLLRDMYGIVQLHFELL